MPIETESRQADPQEQLLESLRAMSLEELKVKKDELENTIKNKKKKEAEENAKFEVQKKNQMNRKLIIKLKMKRLERLEREKKKLEELENNLKKNSKEQTSLLIQNLAKVEPRYFVELTPESKFFDPEFMRYIPGDKYMALMNSNRLNSDQKERATRARLQFCWDWLNGPKAQEYYLKKKEYEEAFKKWLEDLKNNPDAPGPLDKDGNIIKQPNYEDYYDKDIKETFRNDIRTVKELSVINNYMPEIFDHFDFVGHIRFPLIGEIRRSEAFAGRGKHIREVKMTDFLDIIRHLEEKGVGGAKSKEFFETFSPAQVKALKARMAIAFDGKERTEISGTGNRVWKSPLVIDLIDRTIIQGFRSSDEGDKKTIVRHILIALGMGRLGSDNEDALLWLRQKKEGHSFYNVGRVVEELRAELTSEQMDNIDKALADKFKEAEKTSK